MNAELENMAAMHAQEIFDDVRNNPLLEKGMRIETEMRGEIVQGKIIQHLGFSEFWLSHKYDVLLDDGRMIDGAFESELHRIYGWKARVI